MSIEQGHDMATTPEKREAIKITYLGRLEDLGLGNPDGIPSKLAEATESDLELFGERLLASSKPIEDFEHDGCIDDRHRKSNGDGSEPQVRERHVSGSGSNLEIALNAEASVLDTVPEGASLAETVEIIDDFVRATSGKKRSAHTEGCGGANGAIVHNQLIATAAAPLKATEAVMSIPEVRARTAVDYDEELGEAVRTQASKTATWLEANNWVGQTYVESVGKNEPAGLEVLQGGDDAFHGHASDALVIDLRTEEVVTLDRVFVLSMSAIIKKATALAGQRGEAGYTQALIADIAKHMAVAKVLPSTKTPVYLIG